MKNKCLIYCRVSTAKQAQEGESLDLQEKICAEYAERNGKEVLKVFRDHFSGRKESRPILEEMLAFAEKHKDQIDSLIFRNIDRITRGGAAPYEIIRNKFDKLGIRMIDSMGIIQENKNTLEHLGVEYDWSRHKPNGMAEILMADIASAEVRAILTRTIGAQISLTRDGYHVGYIPDGFILKKTYFGSKKRSILVPDPERAKYWIGMFRLRASGAYSDQEIADKINAMGFKTRVRNRWGKSKQEIIGKRGGNPLTTKELQQEITNPIYCGIKIHKWTNHKPIKAQFDGLVDLETFNRANRGKIKIIKRGQEYEARYDCQPEQITLKRMKDNPLFPFKFILCPHCKKPFLGSSPKGKAGTGFPTYHCSRGHEYLGVPKKKFEADIKKMIEGLEPSTAFNKTFEMIIIDKYRERQQELITHSLDVSRNISELKAEQKQSIEAITKTNSEIVRQELEKKVDELEAEIQNAKAHRNEIEVSEEELMAFIKFAKNFMEHLPETLLNKANLQKQRALWGLLFREIPDYSEILSGTPKISPIFENLKCFSEPKNEIARDEGIEPPPKVLETSVLPLYESRSRPLGPTETT